MYSVGCLGWLPLRPTDLTYEDRLEHAFGRFSDHDCNRWDPEPAVAYLPRKRNDQAASEAVADRVALSRRRSRALVGGYRCPGSFHQLWGACLFGRCREPFVLRVLFGARKVYGLLNWLGPNYRVKKRRNRRYFVISAAATLGELPRSIAVCKCSRPATCSRQHSSIALRRGQTGSSADFPGDPPPADEFAVHRRSDAGVAMSASVAASHCRRRPRR